MPQVDTNIRMHRIAALLTISHSRTVPIYSRGEGKLEICAKNDHSNSNGHQSAATTSTAVVSIINAY